MPAYVFQCLTEECNCRFERVLKMGEHPTYLCPNCKEPAPRSLQNEGFAFGFEVQLEKEGNTGVHKEDYPTADHAVGRSANRRWASYEQRKAVKEQARELGGTKALIRHDGSDYVDYEPMSAAGAAAHRVRAKKLDATVRAVKESSPAAR